MELIRENIDYDYENKTLSTHIIIKLSDRNGMVLKAKAEFMADVIEAVNKIIDAKTAEFAEIYGEEVIKNTHHNISTEDLVDFPKRKTIYNKEVQQKLLDKAFENDPQN